MMRKENIQNLGKFDKKKKKNLNILLLSCGQEDFSDSGHHQVRSVNSNLHAQRA